MKCTPAGWYDPSAIHSNSMSGKESETKKREREKERKRKRERERERGEKKVNLQSAHFRRN